MRPASRALVALCIALPLLFRPSAARASLPLERCVEQLDDAEVTGRLAWLERLFAGAERRGRTWFWTWLSAHAAVSAAGIVLATQESDPLRRDAFAIVSATSVGMIGLMLVPPLPSAGLLRRFHRLPDATAADRRAKLDRSIVLLRRAAHHEARGRAWYHHAFALTFATTESFFLGVRHRGRPAASIVSGAATLALLEAQIVTTPRTAYRAAIDFEYGSRPCMAPQARDPVGPTVELVPVPGGLGLGFGW